MAIDDVSATTFEYHLIGPNLAALGFEAIPDRPLSHVLVDMAGADVRVIREDPTGRPGLTLVGPIEAANAIKASFEKEGLAEIDAATFDVLRVEAGTPISGRDVTPNHLPQEVGRDDRAIDFVKGCYLGQETVARLDALGHVNKILKGLRVEGAVVPPPGASVTFEGKSVGTVTSSAWSEGWGGPVALAYLRVAQAGAGTGLGLTFEGGEARAVVADLPMLPPDRARLVNVVFPG